MGVSLREELAERLLAEVMQWSPEDVSRERPLLQDLASYKYDDYQQFTAGMHFIERLAVWLRQFAENDRHIAYDFITQRLIFISETEMRHLVSLAFPDLIRPILLKKIAHSSSLPDYMVGRITAGEDFPHLKRRSLFLGLSDGARVDVLRRMAGLNNEQVHGTYELPPDKSEDMLEELRKDEVNSGSHPCFQTLFLLDDFSGSGDSLLRLEEGSLKGKMAKCLKTMLEANSRTPLLDIDLLEVHVILYLVTEEALSKLRQRLEENWPTEWPPCEVSAVYTIPQSIKISTSTDPAFDDLLNRYYDARLMDKHLQKGGADVIHGYAGCSLPLVLNHNTPNNSVYLLWANKPTVEIEGLFPRVSRHRDEA